MNRTEIEEVNRLTDESMFKVVGTAPSIPPVPSVIKTILGTPSETLDAIFSHKGVEFKNLIVNMDLEHPDWPAIMPENKTAVAITQAIQVGGMALNAKMNDILPYIFKSLNSEVTGYFRGVDNGHIVRLFKNPNHRAQLRAKKKMQEVNLRLVKTGCLSSFKLYIRYNKTFETELKAATAKAEKYRRLGCSALQLSIMKSLESCKNVLDDAHCGFHRITMSDASVILARVHECGFSSAITFPKERVPDRFKLKKGNVYFFQPRAYPMYMWSDYSFFPDKIKKMVEYLEKLPEKNGKPIFDHFILMVPGFKVEDKGIDIQEMDTRMFMDGHVTPILLGERDGKCHFISYVVAK